jgi:hypothetical protein
MTRARKPTSDSTIAVVAELRRQAERLSEQIDGGREILSNLTRRGNLEHLCKSWEWKIGALMGVRRVLLNRATRLERGTARLG